MTNIDIARRYLALLTDPASTAEQLDAVIAPEIIVEEAPNLVAPMGRKRDYQAIREGFTLGKTLLTEQQYTIDGAVESGDLVILEVRWRGVLARASARFRPAPRCGRAAPCSCSFATAGWWPSATTIATSPPAAERLRRGAPRRR